MDTQKVQIGDFVELNGSLGFVVGVSTDEVVSTVPEDHVAVWFGPEQQRPISKVATGKTIPEVWIVPAEYCMPAPQPVYYH